MAAALSITRGDYTAAELRGEAKRTDDADAARRMLALALVLEGKSRGEAARCCGMELKGLRNRVAPGAKPRLSPEQQREVAELVRQGPDLAEHGVVRWRRIDLSRVIEQRYGIKLAERSVGALLRRLGFRRISVRPRCPAQDAASQEAHKKTSPIWLQPPSRRTPVANRSSFGGRMKRASASKAR
jgi:transposase